MQADVNLIGSIYGKIDADMRISIASNIHKNSILDMHTSRITQVVQKLAKNHLENSMNKSRKLSVMRGASGIQR